MPQPSVAIIGAGLTGLLISQRLDNAGIITTIFDKVGSKRSSRNPSRRARRSYAAIRSRHTEPYRVPSCTTGHTINFN